MFLGWRLQVREAETAFEQGRLEDARRLLEQADLQQYLPGKRLTVRVAHGMAQRAVKLALAGDGASAWQQWEAARTLGGETEELLAARQELIELELSEAEQQLRGEDATGALARLTRIQQHHASSDAARLLKEVAQRMESAHALSQRGRFADAEAQLHAAARLRPDFECVQQLSQQCHEHLERHRALTEQMHRAVSNDRWSDALALADQLLELAPEHRVALDVRKRAWAQVGTRLVDSRRLAQTQVWSPSRLNGGDSTNRRHEDTDSGDLQAGPRFLLWVDAVGGYLVCLNPGVVIGQAVPGNHVDVPILGDLSRRHVRLLREGEGYMLEALGPVRVGQRVVQGKVLLRDGDELELGEGVRLRFRQPHALSASACLDFLSRHRTQPWADGVILMAESCVLGPRRQDHILCRDWTKDVVLFRRGDELYCRAPEPIEIDGQFCEGRGCITCNSHITGSDFAMSLEELDKCKNQPLP